MSNQNEICSSLLSNHIDFYPYFVVEEPLSKKRYQFSNISSRMSKYSKPFTAQIHHFLKVCMDINDLESDTKKYVDKLVNGKFLNTAIIKKISDSYERKFHKLKKTSEIILRYIYGKSKKENFYFFDCPFEVYHNHFEPRKIKFLESNIDAEEIHFIQKEINCLKEPSKHKTIKIKYHCINKYLIKNGNEAIDFSLFKDPDYSYNSVIYFNERSVTINYSKLINSNSTWQYSFEKKLYFLNSRLIEIEENKKVTPIHEHSSARVNQLSTNQAIILLDRLGIFNTKALANNSNNSKRDKIISLLIGKNAKNISIAMNKLSKSPKENGNYYKDDIKKINLLLSGLKF